MATEWWVNVRSLTVAALLGWVWVRSLTVAALLGKRV